ncbi:protease I [Catalinimonas alkaloidigena]|uniref:type 1 glutamine amidotransferase domain-containing protein n=1 Tax=Catalinimonas alkaloidigena TaxID=1075417 RepID=UPI0024052386|nr:type 1 glutamine amidotransferase domain-containing protein [Catalinimonas alkaloidigena]MDF9797713.1 protease I [Catalinimonas alkaloidigena]
MNNIKDKNIAFLVANGFEEVELSKPIEALQEAGANIKIVSTEKDNVKAWDKTDWGKDYPVDVHIDNAQADDFDAIVLPGGQLNPDFLRVNEKAVNFVKAFAQQNKLIAAICHGPWTLIEADLVSGKRMTSYPSIQTDLKNAGAQWVDEEVVEDQGIITSRKPDDIPAFNKAIIEAFEQVTA